MTFGIAAQAGSILTNSLAWKEPCFLVGLAQTALSGGQTCDGVSTGTGKRILLTEQTDAKENGIWVSHETDPWVRAADASSASVFLVGTFVHVYAGDTKANTNWALTNLTNVVVGTDDITFEEPAGGGGGGGNVDVTTPTSVNSLPYWSDTSATLSQGTSGPYTSSAGAKLSLGTNANTLGVVHAATGAHGVLPTFGTANVSFSSYDSNGTGTASIALAHYHGVASNPGILLSTTDNQNALLITNDVPTGEVQLLSLKDGSLASRFKVGKRGLIAADGPEVHCAMTITSFDNRFLMYLPTADQINLDSISVPLSTHVLCVNSDKTALQIYDGADWNTFEVSQKPTAVITVTGPTSVTFRDLVLCNPTSNDVDIELPQALASDVGRKITIKNTTSAAGFNINLNAFTGQTIDGSATVALNGAYKWATVQYIGTNQWILIS